MPILHNLIIIRIRGPRSREQAGTDQIHKHNGTGTSLSPATERSLLRKTKL